MRFVPDRRLTIGMTLAAFFVAGALSCLADDAATMARVVNDWKRRSAAVRTARYVVSGTTTVTKGAYNDFLGVPAASDHPPADTTIEIKRSYIFDLEHNRVRKEITERIWSADLREFLPHHEVFVFDGDHIVSWRPRDDNKVRGAPPDEFFPEYGVFEPGAKMYFLREPSDMPLWFVHGAVDHAPPSASDLRHMIDPSSLAVDQTAPSDVGYAMLFARSGPESIYHYRVALAMDSAVVQWTSHDKGILSVELLVNYRDQAGARVPDTWSLTDYRQGGRVGTSYRLKLHDCVLNGPIDAGAFVLKPRAGAVVHKGRGIHRVGADGETLTPIRVPHPREAGDEDDPAAPMWSVRTLLMILGPASGIVLVVVALLRKRKRQGVDLGGRQRHGSGSI